MYLKKAFLKQNFVYVTESLKNPFKVNNNKRPSKITFFAVFFVKRHGFNDTLHETKSYSMLRIH